MLLRMKLHGVKNYHIYKIFKLIFHTKKCLQVNVLFMKNISCSEAKSELDRTINLNYDKHLIKS